MRQIIFNFNADDALFHSIATELDANRGVIERRSFPDGETYIRFQSKCVNRQAIVLCSLDRPDTKVLPLLLAADTLRDLGASRVGIIAPYLAYMRQDKRFHPGEGITARYFAKLLSDHFDWLVTVDPHLHRIQTLDEIYQIPTNVVAAAPQLADWIKRNEPDSVLIGPDGESEQWVSEVATHANVPALILEKTRSGDRVVEVSIPHIQKYHERTPILIDDIISTGYTMVATIEHLIALQMRAPVCMAIHGVFAEGAIKILRESGAARVITCNTIEHESNAIDLSQCIAAAARVFCDSNADSALGPMASTRV